MPTAPDATERPRQGRPPRISRELIVRTAHEIGLADLTLKGVADRLGVTVASLYHHVDGREGLLRLVAEYGMSRSTVPVDRGQHWAVWLREWADHVHDSFLAQPEMIAQYLDGALAADSAAKNMNAVHELLAREGFDIAEASLAYELVVSYAIGNAVSTTRKRRATQPGKEWFQAEHRGLDDAGPDALPHLRRLHEHLATKPQPEFDQRLEVVLRGIAARRGEPWEPIAKALAADTRRKRRTTTS